MTNWTPSSPSSSYKLGEIVVASYDTNIEKWWYDPFVRWWKDVPKWVKFDDFPVPLPCKHPLYDLLINFYKPSMQKAYWYCNCICTSHSGQGTELGGDDA